MTDLSASRAMEENIRKVCRAFFYFSSVGVSKVTSINPLSSREVIESCVMPVLLYGSENWILMDVLIEQLEAFQAELVKRVLKWLKHYSNTAAIAVLDVPTTKCRVLVRKLGFLMRVMAGDMDSLSGSVLLALCDEIESICLVSECRDMEEWFSIHFTNDIIKRKTTCSFEEMKKAIIVADKKMRVEKCARGEKARPMIAKVAKLSGMGQTVGSCS